MLTGQSATVPEETSETRFGDGVAVARANLEDHGFDQDGLVVTPLVQIQWNMADGRVQTWLLNSEGYVSEFHNGNTWVRYTKNGNPLLGFDVIDPAHGLNQWTSILELQYDLLGENIIGYYYHPSNEYHQVGLPPQLHLQAIPQGQSIANLSQTKAECLQAAERSRNDASRAARAANKQCLTQAMHDYNVCLFQRGLTTGIAGADVGAAIGAAAGGIGAAPGAIVGGYIGLLAAEISCLSEYYANCNYCNNTLKNALDQIRNDYVVAQRRCYDIHTEVEAVAFVR